MRWISCMSRYLLLNTWKYWGKNEIEMKYYTIQMGTIFLLCKQYLEHWITLHMEIRILQFSVSFFFLWLIIGTPIQYCWSIFQYFWNSFDCTSHYKDSPNNSSMLSVLHHIFVLCWCAPVPFSFILNVFVNNEKRSILWKMKIMTRCKRVSKLLKYAEFNISG